MNDLDTLYRQVIMEHYKNPRNKGLKELDGYVKFHIKNPSCGDDITIEALIKDDILVEVNHDGTGCTICCSSASVMSELMIGKTLTEAKAIIKEYFKLVKGESVDESIDLEDAFVYKGVQNFPARVKCATLSWLALEELIGSEK